MTKDAPSVLLTGAGGFLGHALRRLLIERGYSVHSSRDGLGRLDLETPGACASLVKKLEPGCVIHAAAIADIAACRSEPERARRVNRDASLELFQASRELGASFVFISTDQVFDGLAESYDEDAEARPLHLYGQTKREVELAMAQVPEAGLVLRLPLMVGNSRGARRSASDQIRDAGRDGRRLQLFVDEWRCPAHVLDVAAAILDLSALDQRGLLHLGGPELFSRADLGRALALEFGFDPEAIVKDSVLAGSPLAAERPARLALDSSRAAAIRGRPLKNLIEAIRELDQTCIDGGECRESS